MQTRQTSTQHVTLHIFRRLFSVILLSLSLLLTGCATTNGPTDERDPWETYNRWMFAFNDDLDTELLQPVAKAYKNVIPSPIRTGVSNFFNNINDVVVVVNDLLQGKFAQAGHDSLRFFVNTVFGLLGIFDVATYMELPKHNEDFGQTLAVWGVESGPYFMLPILGPSTIRDTTGLAVDAAFFDPLYSIEDDTARYLAVGLKAIDTRTNLLAASKIMDQAALDRYAFLRDAYLQRRENLIYDGNPPKKAGFAADNDASMNKDDLKLQQELDLELEKALDAELEKALEGL